jgi:hypothetical protein
MLRASVYKRALCEYQNSCNSSAGLLVKMRFLRSTALDVGYGHDIDAQGRSSAMDLFLRHPSGCS